MSLPQTVEDPEDGEHHEPTAVTGAAQARFGRYRLCFELASGGMATVFLARADGAAGVGKIVALKRIHPHLAKDRAFVEMFLDEARIAARISHPNVCTLHDFGEVDGTYYIAMEYLVGETLARVMSALSRRRELGDSPKHYSIVARIGAEACEGLHAAHEVTDAGGRPLHVVHRDVSPQNVFVGQNGTVSILDFGIARASGQQHRTATGVIKGKYAYMAPEQLRAQPVDRRADIWSLGVILWELTTMRRLFRRAVEAETIVAVSTAAIPPPSAVRPGVPPELDAIVLRALCRQPEGRYATARELGRDLVRFGANAEPVGAADVAEWLETLLPDRRLARQQLVDIAQRGEAIPVVHEPDSLSDLSVRVESRVRSTPRGRTALAIAVVGGVAVIGLLAGGALGVSWLSRSDAGDAAADAPPPASPVVAESVPAPAVAPPAPSPDDAVVAEPPAPAVAEPRAAPAEPRARTAGEAEARAPSRRRTAERPDPPRSRPIASRVEPRAAGTGTVSISTPGTWAEIRFEGRRIGQSPGRVTLPAGRQVIEVLIRGQPPGRRVPVEVVADRNVRLTVPGG